MTTPRQIADWLESRGHGVAAECVRSRFASRGADHHSTIARIQNLWPVSTVSLSYRDNLCVAAVVVGGAAFERKGADEDEACLRLLDSLMQHKSEQEAQQRRMARTAND